jgi:hypothetical protein
MTEWISPHLDLHSIEKVMLFEALICKEVEGLNWLPTGAGAYVNRLSDQFVDGEFESWISATNLTAWTETVAGTSSVNREATTKHGGTYACRLDIDSSNSLAMISQTRPLKKYRRYRLSGWIKTAVGATVKIEVKESSGAAFLSSVGSWVKSTSYITVTGTGGLGLVSIEFNVPAEFTSFSISFSNLSAANESIYLDDFYLDEEGWSDGITEILDVKSSGSSYTKAASVAACDSTASSWFYDSDANKLYIHTVDGDSPSEATLGVYKYLLQAFTMVCICDDQARTDRIIYTPTGSTKLIWYIPILSQQSLPEVTTSVADYHIGGVTLSFGTVKFNLCPWILKMFEDWVWDNANFYIKLGIPGSSYVNLLPVFYGKLQNTYDTEQEAGVETRDVGVSLLREIPTDRANTTIYANLDDGAEGTPIPLPFGNVIGIVPVQVDTVTRRFKFASYPCRSLVVRRLTGSEETSVTLTTPSEYSPNLTDGEFTLGIDPGDDVIVCDVEGVLCNPEVFSNGNFESWTGDDPDDWTVAESGASTVTKEATDTHLGGGAAKLTVDGSNSAVSIHKHATLSANKKMKVHLWYKTEPSKTAYLELKNSAGNVYLKSDGTWNAGAATITLPDTGGEYVLFTLPLTVNASYTDYVFTLGNLSAASSVILFDDVHLIYTEPYAKLSGVQYSYNVADILYFLLVNENFVDGLNVDYDSFLDVKYGRSYEFAFAVRDATATQDIINRLQQSAVFHWVLTMAGIHKAIRFVVGPTPSSLRVKDENYLAFSSTKRTTEVYKKVVINFAPNPADDTSASVESVDENIATRYGSDETLTIATYLKQLADAQNLAEFYRLLVQQPSTKLELGIGPIGMMLTPTDKILVSQKISDEKDTYQRYDEAVFRVLEITKNLENLSVQLVAYSDITALTGLCESCFLCQLCNLVEDGTCSSCFGCQECFSGQCSSCQSCDSCQRCDSGQCDTCQRCYGGACQACVLAYACTYCYVCYVCYAGGCQGACYDCQIECANCVVCQHCVDTEQ